MTESEKEIDVKLIADLKSGKLEAFDKIVERYQRKIYALSFNITRNQMDAEDVVQDVLLSIFRKIDSFQGKSAFSSWVYRVTLNATYMKLRGKKKDKFVSLDDEYPAFNKAGYMYEKPFDWSTSAESLLFSNETREIIGKAVDLLPEKERVVFILRDVNGFSTDKVGELLELSIPAVKSRLHRARLFLRKKLSHYFEEFYGRGEKK